MTVVDVVVREGQVLARFERGDVAILVSAPEHVTEHELAAALDAAPETIAAHNARIDDKTYHRRSIVESIFFALRKRFGSMIKARTWFGQFREIVLKAAVRNIEQSLTT